MGLLSLLLHSLLLKPHRRLSHATRSKNPMLRLQTNTSKEIGRFKLIFNAHRQDEFFNVHVMVDLVNRAGPEKMVSISLACNQ